MEGKWWWLGGEKSHFVSIIVPKENSCKVITLKRPTHPKLGPIKTSEKGDWEVVWQTYQGEKIYKTLKRLMKGEGRFEDKKKANYVAKRSFQKEQKRSV